MSCHREQGTELHRFQVGKPGTSADVGKPWRTDSCDRGRSAPISTVRDFKDDSDFKTIAHISTYRSSIQGASQGVEDGVSLAVALESAGKGNIALATRVFEHLRCVAQFWRSLNYVLNLF